MPDPIKDLFQAVKDTSVFISEQDLRNQIQKSPKDVFDVLSKTNLFLDYNDFTKTVLSQDPPSMFGKDLDEIKNTLKGYLPKQRTTDIKSPMPQVKQKAEFEADVEASKPKVEQLKVFSTPKFKVTYPQQQELSAKVAGFQNAAQMNLAQQNVERRNQEELQKAADELYETTAGKLYFNIVQPLANTASRNIGNIGATVARTFDQDAIADALVKSFTPEKRWEGTIAGTTPTRIQGNLFNDGKMNMSKLPSTIVGGLTDMAWLLAPSTSLTKVGQTVGLSEKLAQSAALIGSSYVQSREGYYQEGKTAGLKGDQLDEFATISSALTSSIEALFPNDIALGKFRSKLAKEYAAQIAKGVSTRSAIKAGIKDVLVEAGIKEPTQELLQLAGDKVAMTVSDMTTGKNNFGAQFDWNKSKDEIYETIVVTPIISLLASGPNAVRNYKPSNYEKSLFYDASKNADKVLAALDNQLSSGGISPEQHKEAVNKFKTYKNTVDQVNQFGYGEDQTMRMAWEVFSGREKLPVTKSVSSDPILSEALGDQIKKDKSVMAENIKLIGMGVPSVGTEVDGKEVAQVIANIGDKGREIDSNLEQAIGEGSYRLEEVNVKDLYNNDPQFKEYVDQYKSTQKDPDGLLVPAVMKDGAIIDGRARLAEQYMAGKESVKVFKNISDAVTEIKGQPAEGNLGQPAGAVQGQQEVGQGTGVQGQAQIQGANVGDSNIGGQGQVAGAQLSNIERITPEQIEVTNDPTDFAAQMTAAQESLGRAGMSVSPYAQEDYDQIAKEGGQFLRAAGNKVLSLLKPNGEMVSLVKDATVKAKGAAQALITRMKDMGGLFMDNYDIYLTPLYEKAGYRVVARVPFNEQYAPEGWNAEDSPLKNKPDVVFMVRNDIAPEQEQTFQDYEEAQKYTQGLVDTAVQSGAAKLPTQMVGINQALSQAIPKATQALEKSGIKFQVVDAATDTEGARAARGNQGLFVAEDGTIIIDRSKLANEIEAGLVVWHEASHPVMNIIRNTNKPLYDAVVRGLNEAAKNNEGVSGALNWAQENYQGQEVVDDEAVVETIGRINSGIIDVESLPTGLRQKLIDFVNSIAKFFGIDPILDDTDIAKFKKTVSEVAEALRIGRDIGEIVGQENVKRFENTLGSPGQAKIDERISEPGVEVPRKEKIPLNINPAKEAEIMAAIDRLLDSYPDALTDRNQWKDLMSRVFSYAGENGEVLIPAFPEGLSRMASSVTEVVKELEKVSPEQRQLASEGLAGTKEIGKMYGDGKMDEVDTGLYFLWNIMSIGISPYPQESGFLQAVEAGVDRYINAASNGKFDDAMLKDYLEWVNSALPTGTPGAGAKSNLNSFGKSFLSKASEVIKEGEFSGKTKLEALHSILSDRTTPTNELRRKWQANMNGMQFNNKIFDFILLTTGRSDLFVIDRVRVDHFWDGDKFKQKAGLKPESTLYDGAELRYKASEGAGFSKMLSDVPGLVFAELANRSMKSVVEKAYSKIGVKEFPDVGRFHWETWVAASAQEVSHGSIDAIVQRKDGGKIKDAGVRQGKYGAWDFNFTYRKVGNQPFRYEFTDNNGNVYIFDDIRFVKEEIDNQSKKNYGTEETRFLLKDERGNVAKRSTGGISKAWYDQPGVDSQKYFDFLRSKAKEVIPTPNVVEDQGVIIDWAQASVGNRGMINWERSPEGKGDPKISSRNPIVTKAAADLKAGKITNEEYRAVATENNPIRPITRFFEPATESEVKNSLSSDKLDKIDTPIQDGSAVGIRLDIPAFKNNNTWVVSVHEGNTNAGKSISYSNVARITDVKFGLEPKAGLKIAAGESKSTIGRIFGKWQNLDGVNMKGKGEAAKQIVQDAVNSPDWVQVGFNPFRHSYFYDRSSDMGRPIVSADEVVQIGGLVYAKKPVYGNWTDEAYRVKGMFDAAGAPVQFSVGNRGDLVEASGNRKQMTEDGDGNYVFFHYSNKNFRKVDPGKFGGNIMTGRDERPGVGISMFYTRPDEREFPAEYGYTVRIPKDQVYPFNDDPLNLLPEARKAFEKDYPGQAFDANKQLGYVTKVAAEKGYPMTVANWKVGKSKGLRAQTTEKLSVKPYMTRDPYYNNVYEFKEEFVPNAKKRGQFSVGNRGTLMQKTSKSTMKSIKDFLVNSWYGYLPKDIQDALKKKQMLINVDMNRANVLSQRLNKQIKEAYGVSYNELDQNVKDTLDAALRNFDGVDMADRPAMRNSIPPKLLSTLVKMRNTIDSMSRKLTDLGLLDPNLEPAFDGETGLGVYINRSYRKYDDKEWVNKIPEPIRQRAIEYIKGNVEVYDDAGNARPLTDDEIQGLINYIATNTDPVMQGLSGANTGRVKVDILKGRKDIPEEIRDLMGEYKDPMVNFAKSIAKMSMLIHTHQTLQSIADANIGTIFFRTPTKDHFVPVAGEDVVKKGGTVIQPMSGLYTTPEIAEAFKKVGDQIAGDDINGWFVKMIMKINAAIKVGKTAGSPASMVRNFQGGGFVMLKDGHIFGKGFVDGAKVSLKYFWNKSQDDPEFQAKVDEYIENGIMGEGVQIGELRAMINASQAYDSPLDWLSDSKAVRGVKAVKAFYSLQDDIFRIWAYENERARLASRKPNMTEAELTKEAARKARATYPTYSEVPKIIQQLAKFIPIASFPAFSAEMIRTTKNSIKIAFEEIADPDMRDVGIKRLAGTTLAIGLGGIASGISAMLSDIGEDEEKAVREFLPEWSRNSQLLWLGRDENGLPIYIDLGFSNPFAYFTKPVVALMQDRDLDERIQDATKEVLSPFLSTEIFVNAIFKGYDKVESSDTKFEAAGRFVKPIYEALEPGGFTSGRRIFKGLSGEVDDWGQVYDAELEIKALMTGQRIKKLDIPVAFDFKARAFNRMKSSAFKDFKTEKKKTVPDPEKAEAKLEEGNRDTEKYFTNLKKQYQAALLLMSNYMSIEDAEINLETSMKENGISSDIIKAIVQDLDYPAYEPEWQEPD